MLFFFFLFNPTPPGLRSIGTAIVTDLIEIVKLRNRLARLLGYEDFYDYKVQQAEGELRVRGVCVCV